MFLVYLIYFYKIIYLLKDLAFAVFYSQLLIDYLTVPNFQAKATRVFIVTAKKLVRRSEHRE